VNRPGLMAGVGVALAAGVVAALLFPLLTTLMSPITALRLLIAGLSGGYLLYLMSCSHQKLGRMTVIAGWALVSLASWVLAPSLLGYAAIHLVMIWLIRSLYFYNSLLSALADLGLTGLALAAAIWAWFSAGSLFLVFWCLFLGQALFVAIPANFSANRKTTSSSPYRSEEDPFEKAHGVAEQALRKIFSTC